MFERFTEGARKVVVLAQHEARYLSHNYIDTEHLLLGLLGEEEGVAARALNALNVTLDEVRKQVESIVGYGEEEETGGQAPFTPRSKKVLELALRETSQFGHNYIGTEHILLGLLRESEGYAVQVLSNLGVDPDQVRREVGRRLDGGRSQRRGGGERGAQDHLPGQAPTTPREVRAEPVRILIADDHSIARDSIKAMLEDEPGLEVVGEASNGREAVELCRSLKPDLVLMDVRMPDMDGLEATRAIKDENLSISVLIVTMHENPDYLREALSAGAAGYILKGAPKDRLIDAIKRTMKGASVLDQEVATLLLRRLTGERVEEEPQPPGLEALTRREIEVLNLLALGETNQEIARDLIISRATAKVHVERIIEKLGTSDRTQAVVRAHQLGIFTFNYQRATSGKTIEEWVGQRVKVALTNTGEGEPGQLECTLEGVDARGVVVSYEEDAKKITRFYPWSSTAYITLVESDDTPS